MPARVFALLLLVRATALADATPPEPPAPTCHDAVWRGIERALASYCKGRTGRGVHGSCADWLRAYRRCDVASFERAASGWHVVLKLFDCHDPVIDAVPDGKAWRVREITLRSYLPPPPSLPRPGGGNDELQLE